MEYWSNNLLKKDLLINAHIVIRNFVFYVDNKLILILNVKCWIKGVDHLWLIKKNYINAKIVWKKNRYRIK